jgi:alpha-glucosidase
MKRSLSVRLLVVIFLLLLSPPALQATAAKIRLLSPDHKIEFLLDSSPAGLTYSVSMKGKPVIENSGIGITVAGVNLAHDVRIGKPQKYKVNETYPWNGVHSTAVNRCNGLRIPVTQVASRTAYTLEVRAYNDGIAFRHIVPGHGSRVPGEATSFQIPDGSIAWYFDPSENQYEGVYTAKAVRDIPVGQWAAPPVTIQLPNDNGYAAITEGDLTDYAGMVLKTNGKDGFDARLGNETPPDKSFLYYYGAAAAQRLATPATISGTITTPWRIVMAAPGLNGLVNCDIVADVSPPPDPRIFPQGIRTPWIKPGRAVWIFLDGGRMTLAGSTDFSRMAGQLGFQYQVVEDQWERWSEVDLKKFVDYSRSQGVGIWLWQIRKKLSTLESQRSFFAMCQRVGVVGVKIDFFDSEAKPVVDMYRQILSEAAHYHLLVDFHGANKPTGEQRTWPNEMTREAVEGMEYKDAPRAQHVATLPFTRLLAGPADYTPVILDRNKNDTTWANQIASAAILTSPLLTYAANPETLLQSPAVKMIESIPSTWDETIVLPQSAIGQVAALARRKGNTWFVAVDNGIAARHVKISLSFLGKGDYRAQLVGDVNGNPAAVSIQNSKRNQSDFLDLDLMSGGGFIGRFTP